jgi:hypothetical protein
MPNETNESERSGRFSIDGFVNDTWHVVATMDERDKATKAMATVVCRGVFDTVRLTLREPGTESRRELASVNRRGAVYRGGVRPARSEPVAEIEPVPESGQPVSSRLAGGAIAVAVFAIGIAFGNWAVQAI